MWETERHIEAACLYPLASFLSQLDAASILVMGAVLLACGCCGLVIVRLSDPRLKGLWWLALSFVAGAFGAVLPMLGGDVPRGFTVLGADTALLLAFVLLHVAVQDIRRRAGRLPKLGIGLLAAEAIGYVQMTYLHAVSRERVVLLSVLVCVQLGRTVHLLLRGTRRSLRVPAWFTAAVLCGLLALNAFRVIAVVLVRSLQGAQAASTLQAVTFLVYIAAAMGIAFGFFWMTTADLTFELEHMASTDPLTRIYNRRVFRDWCDREMARSRARGVTFSVMMMDLDHFKSINDKYGHQGGDELLCAVVERMQDSIRGIDILGRWGGEEFVALLPGAKPDAALLVAQRVRKNIEALVVMTRTGKQTMRLTMSVGVATYRGSLDSLDEMFERADDALYKAKRAGRNRVLVVA